MLQDRVGVDRVELSRALRAGPRQKSRALQKALPRSKSRIDLA
jgi:hypothetical protein